jgi:hypothetical protein
MRRLKLNTRRRRVAAALGVAVVAVGAALAIIETRAEATNASRLALDPSNFAALNTPATALRGVPAGARIGPGSDPAPGTVHELGRGAALAWVAADRVCWSSGHAAGCAVPLASEAQAIDPVLSDPDAIKQGQPTRVSGLAIDGVTQVTATLKDGSRLSSTPIDNWYQIELPASAAPWDVTRIEAKMSSGETIPFDLPAVPLPGQ